ncbi:MAG: CHAD domain-containing protein [Pirellulales bacterium]|nr:CHAD domain-containing protein [Pirellulales bacterium]
MARRGKWLSGVSPQMPASEAARLGLESRLHLVWRYLPLAAQRADEDLEYVHQLRVASRRAVAALECFAEFAPPRGLQKLARDVKRIRKAAGAARDADVLLDHLRERSRQVGDNSWKPVIEIVLQRRHKAQRPIEKVYQRLAERRFGRKIERFLHKVHFRPSADAARTTAGNGSAGVAKARNGEASNGKHGVHVEPTREPSFGQFALTSLSRAVEVFFAAGQADLHDIAALHEFRIRGKALRYSIELFAGAFPPVLREQLYPFVEEMQERLGDVNDHAAAITTFTDLKTDAAARAGELIDRLLIERRAALTEAHTRFLEWWAADRAAELRARFDDLLAGSGGERTAAALSVPTAAPAQGVQPAPEAALESVVPPRRS